MSPRVRATLVAVALAALTALYVWAAWRQATVVNTSLENTDQGSYLEYVANFGVAGYDYIGGRNQMPVYPFVQSLFYDSDATTLAAFERAKIVNIVLSLVLLAAIALVLRRWFDPLQTAALVGVTAFTVFVFKAGYVQTELLYYTMAFGVFLLLARLLINPSWGVAAATGVLLGIAHLTKASVLPAVLLFSVLAAGRAVVLLLAGRRLGVERPARAAGVQVGAVVVSIALFLLTASPYLATSKRVFGHAFYNVNSTFYMWYDNWGDAMHGTIAHGDRVAWPDLPPAELPGPAKYLREHTVGDIVGRVNRGFEELFGRSVQSYGYWKYVAFYLLAALAAALFAGRRTISLAKQYPFVLLFALGYVVGYTLLYAWYVPVAAGNRLILSVYLPLMSSAGLVLVTLARSESTDGRAAPWLTLVHAAMLVALLLEIPDIVLRRIVAVYGGG